MKIAVRADASLQIGTGHVMRCLSLAHTLKSHGSQVTFIIRDLKGNISALIEKNFETIRLPAPISAVDTNQARQYLSWLEVDFQTDIKETRRALESVGKVSWLIVDHYALDSEWETALKDKTDKIMVIDDLFNRRHSCDLLLDQNIISNDFQSYQKLIPTSCKTLLGPDYALLREGFTKAHKTFKIEDRSGQVRKILVSFGGTDATNETLKTLKALAECRQFDLEINVVIGASNPHKKELALSLKNFLKSTLHVQTEKMVELMAEADLAIGASGTTAWERCSLGLPTLTLVVAENQFTIAQDLHKYGAICNLGKAQEVSVSQMATTIKRILESPQELKSMAQKAFSLVDGNGCKRVLQTFKEMN